MSTQGEHEVRVPEIGDFDDVEVVEILVAKGDRVEVEDPLVSIESDKATMEVPSPVAGEVVSVEVAIGDRVSEGTPIARIQASAEAAEPVSEVAEEPAAPAEEASAPVETTPEPVVAEPAAAEGAPPASADMRPGQREPKAPPVAPAPLAPDAERPHASPLVRGMAREWGVELAEAQGSGPAGRILVDDLKSHVRDRLQRGGAAASTEDDAPPAVDFSRFGPVREEPLARIRRVSARNLSRAWRTIPHVTQHDEADVTALEAFRKGLKERAAEAGVRLSPLVFAMKAVVSVLRRNPDFRSSLSADGESLVVKDYYHLGIAVDTDNGLIVPVIRDVDRKGVLELAGELAGTAERARNKKLKPDDLQGAVFSISSLGGIGGTHFTPIVNPPEVAILGLSRQATRPVWNSEAGDGGAFVPRTMLPLSLSYDHRVIDGAAAARFTSELASVLSDPANLLL